MIARSLAPVLVSLLGVPPLRAPRAAAQPPARKHVAVATLPPRPEDVASVNGIIKAFYEVISGPAGQPRQWARDRSLYIPGVRFVATGVGKRGPYAAIMDHQTFVDEDRKSTRLNSSHLVISYAVFCLKKKKNFDRHENA